MSSPAGSTILLVGGASLLEEMLGEAPTRFIHPDCIGDSIALWLDLQKAAEATISCEECRYFL